MKLLEKIISRLGIGSVKEASTKVETGAAVRNAVGGLALLLGTAGCANSTPPSISPEAQAQASADVEGDIGEANIAPEGVSEVHGDPGVSQTRESKLAVIAFKLGQAGGIPAIEAAGLTQYVERLENDT